MHELEGTNEAQASRTRLVASSAGLVLLAGIGIVFLPWIPILLGVLLLAAVGGHFASPDVRRFVQPLLGMPVAGPGRRGVQLFLAASLGVLLLASGSMGASIRGQLRGSWQRRELLRAADEEQRVLVWDRVEEHLATGNVESARFALLEAEKLDLDPELRSQLADLLERLRLCNEPATILDLLLHLSEEDFDAVRTGAYVPQALEFGEPALTRRAVGLALAQFDEAERLRARP